MKATKPKKEEKIVIRATPREEKLLKLLRAYEVPPEITLKKTLGISFDMPLAQ